MDERGEATEEGRKDPQQLDAAADLTWHLDHGPRVESRQSAVRTR